MMPGNLRVLQGANSSGFYRQISKSGKAAHKRLFSLTEGNEANERKKTIYIRIRH